MTGFGGRGHRFDRTVFGAGVVLGDPHDQTRHNETDNGADEKVRTRDDDAVAHRELGVPAQQVGNRAADQDCRDHRRGDEALVERAHDRPVGAELDEPGRRDRADDADAANDQREQHHLFLHRAGEEDGAQ
jgi:hypothetical protein